MKVKFTVAGLHNIFTQDTNSPEITSQEKKAMRWDIASTLVEDKLPLHSCLIVKNGKGILICGESASGKSTLSKTFLKQGYTMEANDFTVSWLKDGKLFAGKLDFEEKNIGKDAVEIIQSFFLIPSDPRDIFRLHPSEAKEFYRNIMLPWPSKISDRFVKGSVFNALFSMHTCLGNRVSSKRWHDSVSYVLSNHKLSRVGIVGAGSLGQDVANLLLTVPEVSQLNIFSRNPEKVSGVVLDLKSADPCKNINACNSFKELLKNSDTILFCFRDVTSETLPNVEERYKRLGIHMKIMWDYSRVIREQKFKGLCLVMTNPVDKLSEFLYQYSNMSEMGVYDWKGLFSNQVYGVGLGLDEARLRTFTSKHLELVGEHGDNQWLSVARATKLYQYNDATLLHKVKNYSAEIRKSCERTRFGPSHEAKNTIAGLLTGPATILRLSTLSGAGNFYGTPLIIRNAVPGPVFELDKALSGLLVPAK